MANNPPAGGGVPPSTQRLRSPAAGYGRRYLDDSIAKQAVFPRSWLTARLRVQDAAISEVDALRDVFNSCSDIGRWDPTFSAVDATEITELVARSEHASDPDARFRMQSFRLTYAEPIIGYFHFTKGEPKTDLLWISMFVIRPEYRTQGYGREIVEGFMNEVRASEQSRAVWLKVFLKNWPALRFWVSCGFTRIVEFRGDPTHDESAEASLVLERVIR